MGKVYLVGTWHEDRIHGPEKLRAFYDKIKPQRICSEFHEDDLEFLDKLTEKLRDSLSGTEDKTEEAVRLYRGIMWELETNLSYAAEHSIPHSFIDDAQHLQWRIWMVRTLEDMIEIGSKNRLFRKGVNRLISHLKKEYYSVPSEESLRKKQRASQSGLGRFFDTIHAIEDYKHGDRGERDARMRDRLAILDDDVIACPVGTGHVQDNMLGLTLYSIIKDWDVERVYLT